MQVVKSHDAGDDESWSEPQSTGPGSVCWMMLCGECEVRMNRGEGPFLKWYKDQYLAERLFETLEQHSTGPTDWFAFYSATLLWRTLMIMGYAAVSSQHLHTTNELLAFFPLQHSLREFILGRGVLPAIHFFVDEVRSFAPPINFGLYFSGQDKNASPSQQHGYITAELHQLHWFAPTSGFPQIWSSPLGPSLLTADAGIMVRPQSLRYHALLDHLADKQEKLVRGSRDYTYYTDSELQALASRVGASKSADQFTVWSSDPQSEAEMRAHLSAEVAQQQPCLEFNSIDRASKARVEGLLCNRGNACKMKHICRFCGSNTPHADAADVRCVLRVLEERRPLHTKLDDSNSTRVGQVNKDGRFKLFIRIPKANLRAGTQQPCLVEVEERIKAPDPIMGKGVRANFYLRFEERDCNQDHVDMVAVFSTLPPAMQQLASSKKGEEAPQRVLQRWERPELTGSNTAAHHQLLPFFSTAAGSSTWHALHVYYFHELIKLRATASSP
jgi:hypothetical protein